MLLLASAGIFRFPAAVCGTFPYRKIVYSPPVIDLDRYTRLNLYFKIKRFFFQIILPSFALQRNGKSIAALQNVRSIVFLSAVTDTHMSFDTSHRTDDYGKHLFHSANEGIFFADREGHITRINPTFTEMLGYTHDQIAGKLFSDIVHRSKKVQKLTAFNKLYHFIQSEQSAIEMMVIAKDGTNVPVRLRSALIKDDAGQVQEAIGMLAPVPQEDGKKTIDQKTWEAQQDFANVLKYSGDSIIICDVSGTIKTCSEQLEHMLHYSQEELLGKHLIELSPFEGIYTTTVGEEVTIDEEYVTYQVSKAEELFVHGRVTGYQLYFIRKDNVLVPVEATVSVLKDRDGERRGSITICRDVTERKVSERKLLEANQKLEGTNQVLQIAIQQAHSMAQAAEQANLAKSEFLANMSHEIRTPMNAVIGFTDMLFDTGLTEEQGDYAGTIKRSAEALLSLINDILDFSKIEAGQIDFEDIELDPEIVAYDVCDMIRPKADEKPIEVLFRVGDNVPPAVTGDPYRIKQVLINLMGNAVKFTEEGEIELSLDIEEEKDDAAKLHVRVRDTGLGIPKDKLETIFEAFKQADGTTTRRYGGTGLGLSISKKIAQRMGGDTWAESRQGNGSIFHFTAWVGKPEKRPARRLNLQSIVGKKVFVVDDNWNNLAIMEHILTTAGMRPVIADSGERVADIFREAASAGDPFDIAILDIQMPRVSGYDVARKIPALDHPRTPLIACSSLAERNAKKCEEAGFDGFLPKPVMRHKLLRMMEFLLTEDAAQEPGSQKEPILTQHSMRERAKQSVSILLAEDNPVNQKLAKTMLEKAGYRVAVASDGREVVDMYAGSPETYDLIFMDVQMPEMSGIDATRELRSRGFRAVPIVAMTAYAMKGDDEKCLAADMNDYITKPIKREVVFEMVKKWVLERETKGSD